jgi:hypothetical protein
MIFGYLMLVIAITISAIAAWYSVAGLAAIFAAAVVPVIIMGGALEAGKIVATVWLHNNWQRVSWAYKTYLVPAIVFLMLLTSMGIFGFLSKGHADQSIVSGDSMSKVAIYDEKIKSERDNIDQAKRALEQMNAQVDQMMSRTDTDRGAERAVAIRKQQARERANLQAEITKSQKNIQALQEERAPLAAEFRKVEAEVGPIKYIAALIYGDNPDQNLLEAAVRWVIILIVVVFDPLALCLILAANKQLEWARQGRGGWIHDEGPGPMERTVFEPKDRSVKNNDDDDESIPEGLVKLFQNNPLSRVPESPEVTKEEDEAFQRMEAEGGFFTRAHYVARALDADDEKTRAAEANAAVAEIEKPEPELDIPVLENEEMWAQRVIDENPATDVEPVDDFKALVDTAEQKSVEEEEIVPETVVAQEQTEEPPPAAPIDEYNTPIRRGADYAVRYKGKVYNLDAFNALHPDMAIRADNDKLESASQCGFGDTFPSAPMKGDMFIRTDYLPDRLFKWNGIKWIEVDKATTDSYTYNQAYIKHLIEKLEAGEYEIEDLSDAEQAQVEQQIEEILKAKRV